MALKTQLNERDARLVRWTYLNHVNEVVIVRAWQYVDATVALALAAALPTTVSGPEIDGVAYGGSYSATAVVAEGQQDRSVTVVQTLHKSTTEFSFTYREGCQASVELVYRWGMTEAAVTTLLATYATSTQGVIVRPTVSRNQDGSFDAVIQIRTAVKKVADSFSSRHTYLRATETVLHRNIAAPVEAPASGVGVIGEATNRLNEDCTYDAQADTTTSTPRAAGPTTNRTTKLFTGTQELKRNQTSQPEASAAAQGVSISVDSSMNEDGTIDAAVSTRTAVPATTNTKTTRTSALFTRTTKVDRNQTAVVEAAAATQGVVSETDNRINEDGTYDRETQTRTATAATLPSNGSAVTTRTAWLRTQATLRKYNQTSEQAAAAVAQGVVSETENALNEDGTVDSTQRTITATARDGTSHTSYATPNRAVTEREHRNRSVVTPAGTAVEGSILEVTNRMNEDGTYDVLTRVSVSVPAATAVISYKDQHGTSYFRAYFNRASADLDGLVTAFATAYADSTHNVAPSISRNEDGTYNIVLTAVAVSGGGSSRAAAWDNFEDTFTVMQIEKAVNDGVRQRRTVTYNCGIKQTTSHTAAYNYIDGKENGNVDVLGGGVYFRATYATFASAAGWVDDE